MNNLPVAPNSEAGPVAGHPVLVWSRGEKWLLGGGVASGTGVGTLGLASSYRALERKAAAPAAAGGWGWGDYAWMLPVGVDLGILTFSIVNLLLVKAEKPLAWVKWVPRLLTIVTVVLNWQTGATTEGKIGHAALAALWVVLSEIAAHLYAAHIGRLKGRTQMERIRLSRWFYKPVSTARVNRLMKSWEITSYEEALERDRQRLVYCSGLREEFGRFWRFRAPEARLRPLRLVGFGMTVEDALGEPERQAAAAELRQQQAEFRAAEAALRKVEAESRIASAKAAAETERVTAETRLNVAKAEADSAASAAVREAEAALRVREAEREAETMRIEAEGRARIEEIALQGERRRTELEAEKQRTAREAAEAERLAEVEAEARRAAAQLKAREALMEAQRKHERQQASWKAEQLKAQREAEEAEAFRVAEARAKQAEIEAAAARAARLAEQEREAAARHAAAAKKAESEAAERAAETAAKQAEAKAKARKAEADRIADERRAQSERTAMEAERAREAEAAAKRAEAEAEARRTPVEREAHKVAGMIRELGKEKVTLSYIADQLGLSSTTTAHDRRKRALAILAEGNGDSAGSTSAA
ncbi:DUF2637 domain-containing protein [Streptomyces syringium]|uniref:DUF2637 domain-containing protein n=1 Tax=Streptomyces syringium TaxID=76729 RepID=UPI003429871E